MKCMLTVGSVIWESFCGKTRLNEIRREKKRNIHDEGMGSDYRSRISDIMNIKPMSSFDSKTCILISKTLQNLHLFDKLVFHFGSATS